MKFIKYFLLILITPLLFGCYDYQEPDEISYIVAVGVDEGTSDKLYSFTIQFARPSQITGGSKEEGGSGKNTTDIVNVEASSLYTAINLANHVVSKKLTLSHAKLIVFSDSVCKKGISPLIDSLGRSSDIRPSVYMCVSSGKAFDYLQAVKPTIEINPVKYYQLIYENESSSFVPVNNAQEVYFNFKNNLKQNVLPLSGVSQKEESKENSASTGESSGGEGSSGSGGSSGGGGTSGQGGGSEQQTKSDDEKELSKIPTNLSGFEYRMRKYQAGNMEIKKTNSSETIGGAVFKEDKMIGTISGIEAEIYNILNGTFNEGYSVIYSNKTPDDSVTIRLEQQRKPRVDVDIRDVPVINTKIYLEGNFVSLPQASFLEKDITDFENETIEYIKNALLIFLEKTSKEFDSDIVGYADFAKRAFLTQEKFDEYNWGKKYKNAKFNIEVDFNIRRTGLISNSD